MPLLPRYYNGRILHIVRNFQTCTDAVLPFVSSNRMLFKYRIATLQKFMKVGNGQYLVQVRRIRFNGHPQAGEFAQELPVIKEYDDPASY